MGVSVAVVGVVGVSVGRWSGVGVILEGVGVGGVMDLVVV